MKLFKHLSYTLLVIVCGANCYCQTAKEVVISSAYRTVPDGKVWVLSNQQDHKVLFQKGAFKSGTSCYAAIYSNPGYLFGISYYGGIENDNSRPKTIGFTFKSLEQIFGSDVHLIQPYFLLKHGMNGDDISNSLSWDYEPMEMVFYPGTVVFASSCIAEMILVERDMTESDNAAYQQKALRNKELQQIKEDSEQQQKRDFETQQVKAKREKFNNPNSVYDLWELDNLNALKFDSSIQEEALNTIINLVKSQEKTAYRQYVYETIQASVQWDSLGNVVDILFAVIEPAQRYLGRQAPTEEFKGSDEYLQKLKEVLTLKAAPQIAFDGQKKKCFVESDLLTFSYSNQNETHFTFRRRKNGYRLNTISQEMNRQKVEEALATDHLSYPVGQSHFLTFYEERYGFTLECKLLPSSYEETTRDSWIILPYTGK